MAQREEQFSGCLEIVHPRVTTLPKTQNNIKYRISIFTCSDNPLAPLLDVGHQLSPNFLEKAERANERTSERTNEGTSELANAGLPYAAAFCSFQRSLASHYSNNTAVKLAKTETHLKRKDRK